MPIGADGLKVGLSTSYVHYKLDAGLLDGTDLSGNATAITALQPLSRWFARAT